jgi:rhodanese-related sulfurtransferase
MPRKTTARRVSGNQVSNFLRRPVVQIGILLGAALAVALIALIGNSQPSSGLAADISVDQAHKLYQQGGTYFLDVREQSEWDQYHIPNTTRISLGDLAARVSELPKDQQIVIVCHSGNRSKQGRDILKQAGFTKVSSMTGGLLAWQNKGYLLEP